MDGRCGKTAPLKTDAPAIPGARQRLQDGSTKSKELDLLGEQFRVFGYAFG